MDDQIENDVEYMDGKVECTKINAEMEVRKDIIPFLEEIRDKKHFENFGEMFRHSFRVWQFDNFPFENNMKKLLIQIEKFLTENNMKKTLQKFDLEIWLHPENQKIELKKITEIIDLECKEEDNEKVITYLSEIKRELLSVIKKINMKFSELSNSWTDKRDHNVHLHDFSKNYNKYDIELIENIKLLGVEIPENKLKQKLLTNTTYKYFQTRSVFHNKNFIDEVIDTLNEISERDYDELAEILL